MGLFVWWSVQLSQKEYGMTKFKLILASALAASCLSAPAFAQEEDKQWEGGYIGGSFGLGAQSSDAGSSLLFDTNRDGNYDNSVNTVAGANAFSPGFCKGAANGTTPSQGCRSDKDDIEYAVRAGYDVQNGNIVYGFLVEGAKSQSTDSVSGFSTTPASYTLTRELDYSVGARARVGYAARGALFYGTGGVVYGKIKNSFSTTNTANAFTDNGKTNSWGWTAGGGTEVKVADNLSVGLEYLYTRYTDNKYVVNVGPGTAPATNPFLLASGGTNIIRSDDNFNTHAIRLTAAFRF
jgi:outer membrane immunogenic protein